MRFVVLFLFLVLTTESFLMPFVMANEPMEDTEEALESLNPEEQAAQDQYTQDYEFCLSEAERKTAKSSEDAADEIYKTVFKQCMSGKGHEAPTDDQETGE